MKKYAYLLFTVLFLSACLVPSLAMIPLGPSSAAANEHLAPAPRAVKPDGSPNWDLLSDAADYFSDHFAFRQELVTADSALKAAVFHTSAQPDVVLGRDGWLFYAETLDCYTGASTLTERQAYCAARSLRLAQDYVEKKGARFTFTIAPNKLSLYPEHGPRGLERAGTTGADRLVEALAREGVAYTDLFGPLAAQEEEMYLRLDSHWTNRGAALGHDLLLESFGLTGHAFDKAGSYQESHRGDLYEMLYPASSRLDRQFEFAEALDFTYTSPIRGADDLRIQTSSGAENGPLLLFRDSFGNALHGLMAESFSEALFVRATPYDLRLMDQIGAQYVAVELVERNLSQLAQAPFVMPAPKLAELTWDDEELYRPESLSEAPALLEVSANGSNTTLSGAVDAPCEPDSPVYLVLVDDPSAAWEAFPQWDEESGRVAFAAYFDQEDSIAFDMELVNRRVNVVYRCNGQWVLALCDAVSHNPEYLANRGLRLFEEG